LTTTNIGIYFKKIETNVFRMLNGVRGNTQKLTVVQNIFVESIPLCC
jgi:hypothetical protein